MSLNTLENQAPPLFKQGPSAISRLLIYSALAIFLMVSDKRFSFSETIRSVLVTAMTPLRLIAMAPVQALSSSDKYFADLTAARQAQARTESQLLRQALRSEQVEQLTLENNHLRALLNLSAKPSIHAIAAEVLYDVPDPFIRRVMIDKGVSAGVVQGSPVVAIDGVLGQVTRVHQHVSEVTLLTHRDHATPVLNVRSGVRSLAYGVSIANQPDAIELRFVASTADVELGDVLTTSGMDGVYPAGIAVAKVDTIERHADAGFARIYATPLANPAATQRVLVLKPVSDQLPPRPLDDTPAKGNNTKAGHP